METTLGHYLSKVRVEEAVPELIKKINDSDGTTIPVEVDLMVDILKLMGVDEELLFHNKNNPEEVEDPMTGTEKILMELGDPIDHSSLRDSELLLCILKRLKDKTSVDSGFNRGICSYVRSELIELNLMNRVDNIIAVMECLFESWDKFSGDIVYPVPKYDIPKFIRPVVNIFIDQEKAFKHLPRWKDEYGQLRQNLLNHMIRKLEQYPFTY